MDPALTSSLRPRHIFCDGESARARLVGGWWRCERCEKVLWEHVPKRKKIEGVETVVIHHRPEGFRYTCRGATGRVLYDSERAFRSRVQARDEVYTRWPEAKITFDIS